ncbi:general alpha-glucoside permease [Colletotrichum scovillei]|uniref:General alpha-glucoside permease n=1 Tax=Colletotrichum scovillei TaxID=1209932 RepID=A0A9P7QTV8_9PEZI|nr:general alpha-glucoside permease [Colletotrichum scovillei]KAG7043400.1 general alpha-glucoside permease [Colletotrichum scovillei]KAG7062851.1 general alpha-glucoside permease [Colletotrichum scovillei]
MPIPPTVTSTVNMMQRPTTYSVRRPTWGRRNQERKVPTMAMALVPRPKLNELSESKPAC